MEWKKGTIQWKKGTIQWWKYDPMEWKYDPMEERYDPMMKVRSNGMEVRSNGRKVRSNGTCVRSNGMQVTIRLHFCPECPSILVIPCLMGKVSQQVVSNKSLKFSELRQAQGMRINWRATKGQARIQPFLNYPNIHVPSQVCSVTLMCHSSRF